MDNADSRGTVQPDDNRADPVEASTTRLPNEIEDGENANAEDQHTNNAHAVAPRNTAPEVDQNPNSMTITVRDNHGGQLQFKIKKQTRLGKLMNAFCERMGKTPQGVRFLWEGERINGTDSPESVRSFPLNHKASAFL